MIFHSELFNYQKVHISVPSSLGLSSKCCETLAIIKSWIADLMEKTYKKHGFPMFSSQTPQPGLKSLIPKFLGQSHHISPHISWMILNMPSASYVRSPG